MAKRPTYSTEFKAGCVALLDGAGYPGDVYSLQRVADKTGVSSRSLRRWWAKFGNAPAAENKANNEVALSELVSEKKLEVKELLSEIVLGIASEVKARIDDDDLADASLPQLMTALGIGIDKSQLLDGKPTAINEDRVSDARERIADKFNRLTDPRAETRVSGGVN